MTGGEALRQGTRRLAEVSDEAGLEAELLLSHTIGLDRVHLYQRLEESLSQEREAVYSALLERRLSHEPTPYIVGQREFYGIQFQVTPAAILPRPETEIVVEVVLAEASRILNRQPVVTIVDVGVGCGAIAVALAAHLPGATVIATDISTDALALARHNAERIALDQRICFLEGEGLQPLVEPVDVIAANLPYVKTDDWERLRPEIRCFEPRQGLDGGLDGLRAIEPLLSQAPQYIRPGGAVVLEIGDEQGEAVCRMAAAAFPQTRVKIRHDLAGLGRVLVVGQDPAAS